MAPRSRRRLELSGRLLFQIKVCETCRHAERSKNLARTVRPLKVEAPWDIVGIDFIGMPLFFCGWCLCTAKAVFVLVQQGRSRRASKATPTSRFSSITSLNGPKRSPYGAPTPSRLPDVSPNAFTGEESPAEQPLASWKRFHPELGLLSEQVRSS